MEALAHARRPFIVAHVTPDADAIGASLGLAGLLKGSGGEPVVGILADAVGMKLRFLFELVPAVACAGEWQDARRHDAIIVLDTAAADRIGVRPMPDLRGPLPAINIDHHLTNTGFGRHNWVDPQATSTSELIARLAGRLGRPLTAPIASLLYAGIHNDTLGFSLPTTTARSLAIAAELVRRGADAGLIGERLCRWQPKAEFELQRRVYDHTRATPDGRIAYSFVTYDDITSCGCTAEDIDNQVAVPRSLAGVQIALFFSEGEPGVIRVNLRGEGRASVVEVAKQLGGGGHRQSAGIRLRGRTMDEAIRMVVEAAEAHLGKQAVDE